MIETREATRTLRPQTILKTGAGFNICNQTRNIRQYTTHHDVEYDAHTPNVGHLRYVRRTHEDLRRRVRVASAVRFALTELSSRRKHAGPRESEIDDLQVSPPVQQQVLALEVAMDDAALVAVLDAVAKLLVPDARLLFRDALDLPYGAEQISAGGLLHDDVDARVRLDRLQEDDDVRVLEDLDDVELARQKLLEVVLRRLPLGDDFHRHLAAVPLGEGELDSGVRAVPERADDLVALRLEHRLAAVSGEVVVLVADLARLPRPVVVSAA